MTPTTKGPDGGYGWVVVIAATMANFMNDGILLSFGIILVELTEVFNTSLVAVAAIPAIQIAITGVVSPFAGALGDEFGKRHVTIVGSVFFSIGLLTSSFASDMKIFYITYGVFGGIGIGLMYGPIAASVVEYFTRRRTLASGIAFCGSGVGIFVMAPLINLLLRTYGWRGAFLVLSGLEMNCIACGLALIPPTHIVTEDDEHETKAATVHAQLSLRKKFFHYIHYIPRRFVNDNLALLSNFRGSCFLVSVFFYGLSINIPYSFIAKQAVELGMGKFEASWLSSCLGISSTVSRVAIGWIGDRTTVSHTVMLKCILLLTGIMLPSSLVITSFEGKLASTAVIGALLGGYISLFPVILADIFTVTKIGKAVGLFMLVISEAAVIGTLVAGWTVDVTGSFNTCFMWGGTGCILSMLILTIPLVKDKCTRITIEEPCHSHLDENTNVI